MPQLLKEGDLVGIIACSDGRYLDNKTFIQKIEQALLDFGLKTKYAKTIYQVNQTPFSGTPIERATELMKFYTNSNIKAIFDISGGDTANQILPYLDFEVIRKNPKPFFGLSDLSVVLNAIYSQSNLQTYHYQLSNIVLESTTFQKKLFKRLFLIHNFNNDFNTFSYSFIRGHEMKGIVIGGNIRCFLKLAGTPYMPDPTNKILFLESYGGGANTMASLLAQLEQLDVFKKCCGVLLGTFTKMEKQNLKPTIEELVCEITEPYHLSIVKTNQLGHGMDAHCLPIGSTIHLINNQKS